MHRWEEDTEGVHVDLRQKSLDWLSECFEAAHQSARQAIDYMCNFIGMKVLTQCLNASFWCRHASVGSVNCGECRYLLPRASTKHLLYDLNAFAVWYNC